MARCAQTVAGWLLWFSDVARDGECDQHSSYVSVEDGFESRPQTVPAPIMCHGMLLGGFLSGFFY